MFCVICGQNHEVSECGFFNLLESQKDSDGTGDDWNSLGELPPGGFGLYKDAEGPPGRPLGGGQGTVWARQVLSHPLLEPSSPEPLQTHLALTLRPPMALAPLHYVALPRRSESEQFKETELIKIRYKNIAGTKEGYGFQKEGVDFIFQNDFNCMIGDKMGLGKTVQALLALANAGEGKVPALFIVKGSTTWQWHRQFKDWTDSAPLGVFLIEGSKNFIPPGFRAYVISMDTLSRLVKAEDDDHGGYMLYRIKDTFKALGIKCVVIDECHSFKNMEAKRSVALRAYIELEGIKYKIFLSGTAIKNRADEYFFTLHHLFPQKFPSLRRFRQDWCEKDHKGKFSHIKEYRLEEFRNLIASKVLRREKGIDLPPFRRTTEVISIEDENVKKAYNAALDDLKRVVDEKKGKLSFRDIQDNLMVLRQIVGRAKINDAIDYIDEFLDSNENEKITIGVHHHSVRDILVAKLAARGIHALKFSGEDSNEAKARIVRQFAETKNRVLVISIVAGGTGTDGLQVCNNVLILERQWNSADEEQFEFRFNRDGQKNPVHVNYMVCKGTIDDYFSQNVERTRAVFGETVGNNWKFEDSARDVEEVVNETLRNRL